MCSDDSVHHTCVHGSYVRVDVVHDTDVDRILVGTVIITCACLRESRNNCVTCVCALEMLQTGKATQHVTQVTCRH